MKKHSMALVCVIVAIIFGALGFFSGMKYTDYLRTQGHGSGFRQFQGGANSGQIQNRNGLGGRPITGEVISKDDKSITVKTQDGGSKIIILSNTTIYSKTSEGTIQDITVGENVGVFGTENSDKSMTAQNVQINPQFQARTTPTPSK
jgi:hypothetical protein